MTSLANIPKQSYFSAVLQTPIDASQTTDIVLSAVPNYTPTGETVYLNILDPNNPETISVTGWDNTTNIPSGVTRGVSIYSGASSSPSSHAAGVLVVLSDDWHVFQDIQTALNGKVDRAGDTMTGPLSFSGATNKGITVSVLTETQRDALSSPSTGLVIANTTAGQLQYYFAGAWYDVSTGTVTPNGSTTVAGKYQTATTAQQLAGTATGSTGAQLVPVTANMKSVSAGAGDAGVIFVGNASGVLDPTILNATATPTASKIVIADANGYVDDWVSEAAKNVQTYVAGEDIDTSSTPLALYLKESDGRVYKLNATSASEAAYAFIGFAVLGQVITTGNNISVQTDGLVSGFSSLTVGGYYYGTNSGGVISTTAGTISLQIGRAITATKLLIQVGAKIARGYQDFTTVTTQVVTLGFKPTSVNISAVSSLGFPTSNGGWSATNGNVSVWNDTTPSAGASNSAWDIRAGGVQKFNGIVDTITSTSFTLNSQQVVAGTVIVSWEAQG